MTNTQHQPTYRRHQHPREIIAHAIWLYFNFNLSDRDVETILAERGITVSYEAIRYWYLKFGHAYARRIRRHRTQTGDQRHVDEIFLKIDGKTQYLYRAIDQHGHILEIMVHRHRNQQAAIRFFHKLLVGFNLGHTYWSPTSCAVIQRQDAASCPASIIASTSASTM